MDVKTTGPDRIPALVQLAESWVSGVKDPELRKIAFGKVLDSLLLLAKRDTRPGPGSGKVAAPKQRSKGGPSTYIEDLCSEGFFQKAATLSDVRRELVNRGHSIPLASSGDPMQRLCKRKVLRRHPIYRKWQGILRLFELVTREGNPAHRDDACIRACEPRQSQPARYPRWRR
jgi:hypothetical protein